MGMEGHRGPKRRRIGPEDASERIQLSIRFSHEAGQYIRELQKPGVLHPDGCSKGDVVETAVRMAKVRRGLV